MPKSLGNDSIVDDKPKEASIDLKKLLNTGVEVNTTVGTFKIREMPGADFLSFLLDSVSTVQTAFTGDTGFDSLRALLQDEAAIAKLHEFFYKSMENPPKSLNDLSELTLSDYIKLLVAVRQAYDWETIQAGFTELGLMEILQTYLSSSDSQETSQT